ncbi:histone deacetylase family protein [Oceaniradius stylonematis]|uniref:histone deacetylase family protein n=1 Tax=Oceaniradius stylonematis TaxID=2184161 RepID=UPI00273CFCF8|nr:histone deacetylase family protein [Oceaniradius stylonematis]
MKVFYDERQRLHDPQIQFFAGKLQLAPEHPSRTRRLLNAALESGFVQAQPADLGWDPILKIHDAGYIAFLKAASLLWSKLDDAGPECVPHIHPVRYGRTRPRGILGLAGYYMNGTNCPIGPHTVEAAYWSAQAALAGADQIIAGEALCYALCRPPGHHAHSDLAGGFCFLNNAAITAQRLLDRYERVAIIDVDVHHGNGTQEIFYSRDDVFCGSVHADPSDFYPFYQGYADEEGEGEGFGWNMNLPLPHGSGDEKVVGAVQRLCARARELDCQVIVVALGLDAFELDPMGKFRVTTPAFEDMARAFQHCEMPVLLVQEGGYDGPHLGENLRSFLRPFATTNVSGEARISTAQH